MIFINVNGKKNLIEEKKGHTKDDIILKEDMHANIMKSGCLIIGTY